MLKLAEEVKVVDADAHMTEAHDLWIKRAPKGYEDRVPRVGEVDGRPTWLIDGQPFGFAGGGGTIDREGVKQPFIESQVVWPIEKVHVAAYDPQTRLQILDDYGIHAQILYPNSIGLSGHNLTTSVADQTLRRLCVEIYNDAMMEMQEWSNDRLLPMPILPGWSVDECVVEAQRVAGLGARGVNMSADPQDMGSPDLANRAWDALWEVCADLDLPVHFHIGGSLTAMNFYGQYFWPSQNEYVKPAIGGSMLFINNARVLINTIYSGMFDRHPNLKMVSVESGIGWVPFLLETMDYEIYENGAVPFNKLERKPSEYFKDHWYGTFWFENHLGDLQGLIDKVGEDNVLFETDFPHPTCLYPRPLEAVESHVAALRPETRKKVMGENAAKLYRL